MHYIPGTPWYDAVGAELELEMAAGRYQPPVERDEVRSIFRPVQFLFGLLSLEVLLVTLVLWID